MVITGAGGQVGRLLAAQAAQRGHDVRALTHPQLDITDAVAVREHITPGDLVVNCAAFTNVDAAESDPEGAYQLNGVGPGNLARTCAKVGARLVHLSTDYVFSGEFAEGEPRPYEIGDATGPIGVYGRTKLDGELAVTAAAGDSTIVRTALVYTGGGGSDFVAKMRRLAATDQTVDMVYNLVGSPTYVVDLVNTLLEIAERDIHAPLLHAVNAGGGVSRFELARAIFAEVGADPERVRPTRAAVAFRPEYAALSLAASVRAGMSPLRPWREALIAALAAPL